MPMSGMGATIPLRSDAYGLSLARSIKPRKIRLAFLIECRERLLGFGRGQARRELSALFRHDAQHLRRLRLFEKLLGDAHRARRLRGELLCACQSAIEHLVVAHHLIYQTDFPRRLCRERFTEQQQLRAGSPPTWAAIDLTPLPGTGRG